MTSNVSIYLRLKNLLATEFFYRRKSAVCQYNGFLITVKYLLVTIYEDNPSATHLAECLNNKSKYQDWESTIPPVDLDRKAKTSDPKPIYMENYSLDQARDDFYKKNRIKYFFSDVYDYASYIRTTQLVKHINDLLDKLISNGTIGQTSLISQLTSLITSLEEMHADETTIRYI